VTGRDGVLKKVPVGDRRALETRVVRFGDERPVGKIVDVWSFADDGDVHLHEDVQPSHRVVAGRRERDSYLISGALEPGPRHRGQKRPACFRGEGPAATIRLVRQFWADHSSRITPISVLFLIDMSGSCRDPRSKHSAELNPIADRRVDDCSSRVGISHAPSSGCLSLIPLHHPEQRRRPFTLNAWAP